MENAETRTNDSDNVLDRTHKKAKEELKELKRDLVSIRYSVHSSTNEEAFIERLCFRFRVMSSKHCSKMRKCQRICTP